MINAARAILFLVVFGAAAHAAPPPQVHAQCSDDYVTVENVGGAIVDIKPAPEPFPSSDIYLSGPKPCARICMQVLKADVRTCRLGDWVEAKGVVTSDPESSAWQINPEKNDYMRLGDDFTCKRPNSSR